MATQDGPHDDSGERGQESVHREAPVDWRAFQPGDAVLFDSTGMEDPPIALCSMAASWPRNSWPRSAHHVIRGGWSTAASWDARPARAHRRPTRSSCRTGPH